RHCARSKSRSLHCSSSSISRWYFEGSVPRRGDGGCGGGFSSPRLYARWATAPPRRAEKKLRCPRKGRRDAQDTQRPGICANGECPIALTTGSQPSSNLGLGAGAGAGVVSAGPFTALRLLVEASGIRSLLSVRLTIGALRAIDGAAVVEETSRPT